MRKIYILFIATTTLLLSGCKPDDFTIDNIAKTTDKIISYDYKSAWNKFKTTFQIAHKTKYYEDQDILIETPRDTQTTTYQNVLSECQKFNCNILRHSLYKNMIFPEHITGNVEFYIPSDSAQELVISLAKYGNIVINDFKKDSSIQDLIENLTNKLTSVKEEQEEINATLTGPNLQNVAQIQPLQARTAKLSEEIFNIQEDITYLQNQIGNRHITIKIRRGFNSTSGFIKSSLIDSFLFILKYANIIIILFLFISIKYLLRGIRKLIVSIKLSLSRRKELKEKQQKASVSSDLPEPKITPQL